MKNATEIYSSLLDLSGDFAHDDCSGDCSICPLGKSISVFGVDNEITLCAVLAGIWNLQALQANEMDQWASTNS